MITKSDWELLGIEPTTDIRHIKKAYAKELKLCSPEDNPVQFQTLRQVYERVLKYAEQVNSSRLIIDTFDPEDDVYKDDIFYNPYEEEPEVAENGYVNTRCVDNKLSEPKVEELTEGISAYEKLIQQINDLYENFKTRLDSKKWDEIINNEVLLDVETYRILKTWFLDFLYAGHFVSREVLQLYNRFFMWEFDSEEYHQKYDDVFLTYIKELINGIIVPGYEYLTQESCEDIDKYIKYREYGFAHYLSGKLNDSYQNVINALEMIPDDPYLLCMFGAYNDAMGNANGKKYIKLGAELSDDPWRLFLFSGQLLHRLGKLKEALRYYRIIPNTSYYYIPVQSAIVDCLCGMGKYHKCGFLLLSKIKKNREDTELKDVLFQYYISILELKRSFPDRLIFWYEARKIFPYVSNCGEKNPHKYTSNYILPSLKIVVRSIVALFILLVVIATRGVILLPIIIILIALYRVYKRERA